MAGDISKKQSLSISDLDGEIWKSISGYEGVYEISNLGRVKSLDRTVTEKTTGKQKTLKGRILKHSIGPYGYPVVNLCKNGGGKTFAVHRLLALAFIPNPENKPHIDHINRDTTDYRIENLHWVTPKENINNPNTIEYCRKNVDKVAASKIANKTKKQKATATAPKTVYQYSLSGDLISKFDSIKDAGKALGISPTGIGQVVDKPCFTFHGYLWASSVRSGYRHTPNIQPYFMPVQMIAENGDVIGEWDSITKAAKSLGVSRRYIDRRLRTGEFRLVKK